MATLFREVNYKLQALVNDIDMGVIGLPDIQRPFVWKDIKVRDLFVFITIEQPKLIRNIRV